MEAIDSGRNNVEMATFLLVSSFYLNFFNVPVQYVITASSIVLCTLRYPTVSVSIKNFDGPFL
jgi:hypothetical protein